MSKGTIKKVAGPLVIASGMRDANMFDVVRVSDERLIGEIIEIHGDEASIQVYEETSGLGPGEPVESMDVPLSVELGPGLLTSIYDGIQRPLDDIMKETGSNNLKRGVEVPSLKRDKKWQFVPTVKAGDSVEAGDIIGTVQETLIIEHKIMVPYGVKGTVKEIKSGEFTVEETVAVIETENGAKTMGKPKGTYITIEAGNMDEEDEDYHREISVQLAKIIRQLIQEKNEELSVLVVGLGNREVTPDALGPRVVDNLFITRHIVKEYGKYAFGEKNVNRISSIVPGVMAQTGMESLEIIHGIIDETKPDLVIVIDALAARSTKRLNRTIQVTDTGINPGSGVGNHRHGLNKKSLGIPVISIGIPTVVDAATIVNDTMFNLIAAMSQSKAFDMLGDSLKELNDGEKYELIRELLSPNLNAMFVTPKDIDESVKRLSYTISEGINIAFMGEGLPA